MEAVMIRILRAVERAYARPPLSWLVDTFTWLPALAGCPLRPLARRHAARKATELTILSAELGAVGLHSESAELARIAARWHGIANDLGEPQ